jgi:RNA polymerase sigma-70 factor, ECF subfamily
VLAATVRVTRDLDAAEESVQDAYVAALEAWSRDGVPARPGAWLTTVARRIALNAMARRRTLQAKLPMLLEPEAIEMDEPSEDTTIPDDRLRLVFTCCHPALPCAWCAAWAQPTSPTPSSSPSPPWPRG